MLKGKRLCAETALPLLRAAAAKGGGRRLGRTDGGQPGTAPSVVVQALGEALPAAAADGGRYGAHPNDIDVVVAQHASLGRAEAGRALLRCGGDLVSTLQALALDERPPAAGGTGPGGASAADEAGLERELTELRLLGMLAGGHPG